MLEAIFERARNDRRLAFIPYVMAGDPDISTTACVLDALSSSGVDAIELGIPYGDPLADGPTIAAAAQRALAGGTTVAEVLQLVRDFRERGGTPVILFTYFNPVFKYGLERFARDAADASASAVIVPDIALEEGRELGAMLRAHGLDMPLLVAPSTRKARAEQIAVQATGFIYVVSRLGVTGAATAPDAVSLRAQIMMLRGVTHAPLALGFGVSSAEHVRAAAPLADGVIVGSALIEACRGIRGAAAAAAAKAFVSPLLEAARY